MTESINAIERRRLQTLAEFRYSLRQFLHFSEACATEAGLQPQQHQLLLHLAGAPDGIETTVSYAAERLGLRHHSVVELSKRCEEAGLVRRTQDADDRRCVTLHVTVRGQRLLQALSEAHEHELSELFPKLIRSLAAIRKSARHAKTARGADKKEFQSMKSEAFCICGISRSIAGCGCSPASRSALALRDGAGGAAAALIALSTNLFYYHRLSWLHGISGGESAGALDGCGAGGGRTCWSG